MIYWENIPSDLRSYPYWVLWRYEQRDAKKLAKVPYQLNGMRASVVDSTHWASFSEVKEAYESGGYDGVGVVFAQGYDLMGFDLDEVRDGEELSDDAIEITKQIESYAEISPSGRGLKIFARGRLPAGVGSRASLPGGGVLEAYQSGRYFTVTGHALGSHELSLAQEGIEQVAELYLPSRPTPSAPAGGVDTSAPNAKERARAYLSEVPPAISGEGGHNRTFHAACLLVNGFALGFDDALEVLQEWNDRCEPPWSLKELQHKLESAEKVGLSDDQPRGYLLTSASHQYEASEQPVEDDEFCEVYLDDLLRKVLEPASSFPEHLMRVPGVIGEVADWITTQNPIPNPVLSLLAAISLHSVMIGRKVTTASGAPPRLYLIGLAPSGGGKQAPIRCVQQVLNLIGCDDRYSGAVTSDSAMVAELFLQPAKLYIWDEFGRFLESTKEKKGGVHLHAVQRLLLECWGIGEGTYVGKSYADPKYNKRIEHPCLSVLGLSVPSNFWESLEVSHLRDGFAARLIVVDSGPRLKGRDIEPLPPPPGVLEEYIYWRDHRGEGGNLAQHYPHPLRVPYTDQAKDCFEGLQRHLEAADDDTATIWARAIEKAKALALIYATSRDRENLEIDLAAAQWGVDFTTWATQRFIFESREEVAEEDRFARLLTRTLKIVRHMSRNRQQCTRSVLLRRLKVSSQELDRILQTMLQSNAISDRTGKGKRGRSYTYYVAR